MVFLKRESKEISIPKNDKIPKIEEIKPMIFIKSISQI